MALMNVSKGPQRSSFISCATGGTSFNYTSFFNPTETTLPLALSSGSSSSSAMTPPSVTAFPDSSPRKRGRKRTKLIDPGHIPRPMNCFIQFRREWVQAHRDTELAKGSKSLSKLAGEAWHSLSKEERDHYQVLAKVAKKEHQDTFPDYKYEPKRKSKPSTGSHSHRIPSRMLDPDWTPSVLRSSSSSSSDRSSRPPSIVSYPSTDESDAESLDTPIYSRGSSVDLSYSPDEDASGIPSSSYQFASTSVQLIKDERTPTQADFSYHLSLLPAQQASFNFTSGSNADLTLPQISSLVHQLPQTGSHFYHALPLQQVAHSLPPNSFPHDSLSLPSSQGSDSMLYYDHTSNATAHAGCNPVQWEQTHHENFYASPVDSSDSQLATATPYSDFLTLANGLPITPLTHAFFERESRSSSPEGLLQDSFIASLDPPPYWSNNVQEAFEPSNGWSMPTDKM